MTPAPEKHEKWGSDHIVRSQRCAAASSDQANSYSTTTMENVSLATQSRAIRFLKGMRPLFYVEPPSQSCFQNVEDVPDYLDKAVPYFFLFIFLEVVVRALQHKPLPRINDSINSLSAGVIMTLLRLCTAAIELVSYSWVYETLRLVELPWDSAWTWSLTFLGVDFFYYWFHRMAHEVNLFWAAHQVHHSSEDYTLSTALRQSAMQRFNSWIFYLPMALAIPPSAFLVHKQFNLLYQFWIHTEVIDHLGPLEWVLNTPSHHRVHHGRNPYCIDKNYAGVLIIWDRMFGTFQPEGEKVIYGLVHPLGTWDPFWAQVHHFVYLWHRFWAVEGLWHKLSILMKGPGWAPGKPRLGCIDDIPKLSPEEKPYDRMVPRWLNVYCMVHFLLVLAASQELGARKNSLPYVMVVVLIVYFILSLTNFGLMFDLRPVSGKIEVLRLVAMLVADFILTQQHIPTGLSSVSLTVHRTAAVFSIALWSCIIVQQTHKKVE